MESGQYDGGSFSGNATTGSWRAGPWPRQRRPPVRTTRTSSTASRTWRTTRRRRALRRAARSRTEPARVQHRRHHDRPDELGLDLGRRLDVQAARSASTTTRLHRGRRAAPHDQAARPRDQEPVPAEPGAVRRSNHAPREAEGERRQSTGAATAIRSNSYAAGDVVTGTTWQFQVNLLQGEGAADRGRAAERGLDRLVGHVDDPHEGREPRTACTCG